MTSYPAEPWALRGQLHASVFLVPLSAVRAATAPLPPGCSPVRLGSRVIIGAVWVSYEPGGVLTYRELMATLLVRRGARLLLHVVAIWVDSPASRDGGRALWGIPKELADVDFGSSGETLVAAAAGRPIASGHRRVRAGLPGRWPVRFSIVQTLDAAAKISPVSARAALTLDSASFAAQPSGPLGFLAGRRPLTSFSLAGFAMCFGRRPRHEFAGPRW